MTKLRLRVSTFRSTIPSSADENVEELREVIHTGNGVRLPTFVICCAYNATHADREFEHEADCCKIRSLSTEWQETKPPFRLQGLRDQTKNDTNFLLKVKDWGERWVYCYDPDSTIPRKYTSWITGDTGHDQETRVPELIPAEGKALVPVYKFKMGILWKGKYNAVNKVNNFVIFFQPSSFWLAPYVCRACK